MRNFQNPYLFHLTWVPLSSDRTGPHQKTRMLMMKSTGQAISTYNDEDSSLGGRRVRGGLNHFYEKKVREARVIGASIAGCNRLQADLRYGFIFRVTDKGENHLTLHSIPFKSPTSREPLSWIWFQGSYVYVLHTHTHIHTYTHVWEYICWKSIDKTRKMRSFNGNHQRFREEIKLFI